MPSSMMEKTSIKGLDSYKNCQFYTMPVTDLLVADQIIAFNPSTMLIVEQEKTSMLIDLAKQKTRLDNSHACCK